MVKSQLKGINKVRKRLKSGAVSTYYYHRTTGKRLLGKPNSPEFAISYAEAESSLKNRNKGKFSGLFLLFKTSPEFRKLADSTQKSYIRSLEKAEAIFGDLPIPALNDPRIKSDFMKWRADVATNSGDRESDNRLSAVSAMITWAVDNGHAHVNHIKGFKRLYKSSRSDTIWEEGDIDTFMSSARLEMQRAMMLAIHTGLRQADILHLKWADYDGKNLTVQIRKNRRGGVQPKPTRIPCTKALGRMLDGMERTSPFILTTPTKRPYGARHFRLAWQRAVATAGLGDSGLHFNDLRGTAITMLAEAGCSIPEIVSITGHKLATATKILEHYLSRTTTLADGAIARFENAPTAEFANRLQTTSAVSPRPEGDSH